MKILMLTTFEMPRRSRAAQIPPLANILLSTYLRSQGHDVTQADVDIEHLNLPDLAARLWDYDEADTGQALDYISGARGNAPLDAILDDMLLPHKPGEFDVIALSAKRPLGARLMAKRLKDICGTPIILGGDVGHDFMNMFIETPQLDYLSPGHGEIPLSALCRRLKSGDTFEGVCPMLCRDTGRFQHFHTEEKQLPPNEKSAPDASGLRHELYRHQPMHLDRLPNPGCIMVLPYYFIEGCPFHCSYCRSNPFRGAMDPEALAEKLQAGVEASGCSNFVFLNNAFNINVKYAKSICRALIKSGLNIRWTDSMRPDQCDSELLELMAEAGCVSVVFGVESGSRKILERMNRNASPEQAGNALAWAHEAGMLNRVNFIVGFPGEGESEYQETVDFIKANIESINALSVSDFYLCESRITENPEPYDISIRNGQDPAAADTLAFDEPGLNWERRNTTIPTRSAKLMRMFDQESGQLRQMNNVYEIFDLYEQKGAGRAALSALYGGDLGRFCLFPGTMCNNACGGCPYVSFHKALSYRTLDYLIKEIRAARYGGYSTAMVLGGEPAVRDDFFDLLHVLKNSGFKINVETNGRVLSSKTFIKRICSEFMDVRFQIVAPLDDEAEHDTRTGVAGSHRQSVAGIRNCQRLNISHQVVQDHYLFRNGGRAPQCSF